MAAIATKCPCSRPAWKIVSISGNKSILNSVELDHHFVLLTTLLAMRTRTVEHIDRSLECIFEFWTFSLSETSYWTHPAKRLRDLTYLLECLCECASTPPSLVITFVYFFLGFKTHAAPLTSLLAESGGNAIILNTSAMIQHSYATLFGDWYGICFRAALPRYFLFMGFYPSNEILWRVFLRRLELKFCAVVGTKLIIAIDGSLKKFKHRICIGPSAGVTSNVVISFPLDLAHTWTATTISSACPRRFAEEKPCE